MTDLRNHLFAQLERLSDEELTNDPEKLEQEVKRSESIKGIADSLIDTAKVEVNFLRTVGGPVSVFLESDKEQNGVKKLN